MNKIFGLIVFNMFLLLSPSISSAGTVYLDANRDIFELFSEVNDTEASSTAVDEINHSINIRLQCFEDNFSYEKRVTRCITDYRDDIIAVARQHIKARPDVGSFLKSLDYCPVIHNLCQGQGENTEKTDVFVQVTPKSLPRKSNLSQIT